MASFFSLSLFLYSDTCIKAIMNLNRLPRTLDKKFDIALRILAASPVKLLSLFTMLFLNKTGTSVIREERIINEYHTLSIGKGMPFVNTKGAVNIKKTVIVTVM